jgi:branched-subunit amino acid transport protein
MDQIKVLMIIAGMMVVTYGPRLLPITFLSSRALAPCLIKWLQLIPSAVLAAMLLPALIVSDQRLDINLDNVFLWAALPTFVVAKWAGSFVGAIVAGMAVVAIGRYIT